MRKILTVSLFFLGLSAIAFGDDWNKTFTVTAKPSFHVVTDDANVDVNSSAANEIRVNVVTVGWKIPDDIRISERQSGNEVFVEVRMTHKEHFSFGNRSIRVTVNVPHEADLDLKTGDGNVTVQSVKGAAHISTGDGNVNLTSLDGSLNASTGDGNIKVRGRFEDMNLHTGDGNMSVYVGAGSKASNSWIFRTGDGNLDLYLPDDFAADVDAHTGDGKVVSNLPVTTSGTIRENELRGKLNGGGSTIELRTGDGTIHLNRMM